MSDSQNSLNCKHSSPHQHVAINHGMVYKMNTTQNISCLPVIHKCYKRIKVTEQSCTVTDTLFSRVSSTCADVLSYCSHMGTSTEITFSQTCSRTIIIIILALENKLVGSVFFVSIHLAVWQCAIYLKLLHDTFAVPGGGILSNHAEDRVPVL